MKSSFIVSLYKLFELTGFGYMTELYVSDFETHYHQIGH